MGNDDVDVGVGAHGPQHAGAGRGRHLQGHAVLLQHRKHVGQVPAVEGDLGFASFDLGVDVAPVLPYLLRRGDYGELARTAVVPFGYL